MQVEPGTFIGVPDRVMTASAADAAGVTVRDVAVHGVGNALVATAAGGLGHTEVKIRDPDRVRVAARGEIKGMKKAIRCLYRIFPNEVVGRVAVITGSGGMMA